MAPEKNDKTCFEVMEVEKCLLLLESSEHEAHGNVSKRTNLRIHSERTNRLASPEEIGAELACPKISDFSKLTGPCSNDSFTWPSWRKLSARMP